MPIKIVVFGKNGQVGYELCWRLHGSAGFELKCFDSQAADFMKPDTVLAKLEQYRPDIIINAAAYTAVDKAESEREKAYQINAVTVAMIAQYAQTQGSLLVHYSTDFVFDGGKDRAYREDDQPRPLSVYGASKLEGDRAIVESGCQHLIFRTSWVYGLRGKNFLLTILRLLRERQELSVVADQWGSPVWCGHIAQTTLTIIAGFVEQGCLEFQPQYSGIYNLTASDHTTWHGFASQIQQIDPNQSEQICKQLHAITTEQYPTPARRPAWSVLDNHKISHTFAVKIPPWKEQLQQCFLNPS